MRNKKISKLVDPSFRLYFLVGFLFAAVTVRVSIPLAICEAAAMAFLWWYFRHTAQKRREGIRQYIDDVTDDMTTAGQGLDALGPVRDDGLPPRHAGDPMEQRQLHAAHRRARGYLRQPHRRHSPRFSDALAARGQERMPGHGDDGRASLPRVRQSEPSLLPPRRTEPSCHNVLDGRDRAGLAARGEREPPPHRLDHRDRPTTKS